MKQFKCFDDDRLSVIDGKMIWSDNGASIVCSFADNEWTYRIVHNGTAITRKIKSKKSPQEEDPRIRDAQIKKGLAKVESKTSIDADTILDAMNDFGIFLVNNEDVLETFIESVGNQKKSKPIPVNEELVAQAQDILKNGDPVKVIMDEFHNHHISDDDYGRLLLCAIASQHIRNTHGIHLTPSGASGKGKSHAGKTMLHLVPSEWWMETSLSPKSLYYNDIAPGTIIFSDDTTIDEDLMSTIRRCITNFTSKTTHRSVNNGIGAILDIPERIIWIIASVENFMDEQTRNRMMDIPVDESEETDERVYDKQVESAINASIELPETHDVLVCREIFRIIKSIDPIPISIPFARDIVWTNKSDRRSFGVFKEIVTAYALIRHRQREMDENGVMDAEIQDFYDARDLYLTKAEGEGTKLTEGERLIIRALEDNGECTLQELVRITKIPQTTLYHRIHGRPDRGKSGLLERSKNLMYCYKETRRVDEETTHIVNLYGVSNTSPLSHYSNVVSLVVKNDI